MKTLGHILTLSLLLLALNARAVLPPMRLNLSTGLSQPVADYASPSLNEGCFALKGLLLESTASANFYGSLWWDARFAAQLHPVDVGRLGYERVIADPFLKDTYIRSEPYRHRARLTGPSYQLDKGSRWYTRASLFTGLMQSKTPYQLHKPTYHMDGPDYFEISSAIDYSLAIGGEIAAAWKATPCYPRQISASFLQTKMDFRFRNANGIRTDSRRISTLNLWSGVAFLIPPQ